MAEKKEDGTFSSNNGLIEIGKRSTYTLNEYSVWLELETNPTSENNKTIMIHPIAFDSIIKAIEEFRKIGAVDGDTATEQWDKVVQSGTIKGAKYGRTSRYATRR